MAGHSNSNQPNPRYQIEASGHHTQIAAIRSDPDTDCWQLGFARQDAKGKGRRGRTWWTLVAGEGRRRSPGRRRQRERQSRGWGRGTGRENGSLWRALPKLRRRRPGSARRIENALVCIGLALVPALIHGPVRTSVAHKTGPTESPLSPSGPAQQRQGCSALSKGSLSFFLGRQRTRLSSLSPAGTESPPPPSSYPWCQISVSPWSRWLTVTTTPQDEASALLYPVTAARSAEC